MHKTTWVRIILVRRLDETRNRIEVELSLPDNIDSANNQLTETITTLIDNMKYFLRLQQFGFCLELIEQDFLWTATIDINEEPKTKVFEILLPP